MHEIKIEELVEFLYTTSNNLKNVMIIKTIKIETATKMLIYLGINLNGVQDHYEKI